MKSAPKTLKLHMLILVIFIQFQKNYLRSTAYPFPLDSPVLPSPSDLSPRSDIRIEVSVFLNPDVPAGYLPAPLQSSRASISNPAGYLRFRLFGWISELKAD
ncbi:hypothetical protein HNY73_010661 [Argiope bruennichi]|uniref:Uncharacterized protein n=1 Tax=Argiope bruennichi TaxID=94029 RepID=A0A8T0F1S9_ARGBR|nr:hypothetical protein HNY73_010661 [Argiope bruennichi]